MAVIIIRRRIRNAISLCHITGFECFDYYFFLLSYSNILLWKKLVACFAFDALVLFSSNSEDFKMCRCETY